MPVTSNGSLTVPPVASAISSEVQSYQGVVEGKHSISNNLSGLVPLARDEHDVTSLRDADGLDDGFAAARHLRRRARAGHDRRADGRRILAAGVVVRDNDHIGEA